MRPILLASTAVSLALGTGAFAADLQLQRPAPVVVAPWAGVYVGGFAGGHWSRDRWTGDETNPLSNLGPFDLEADGFTGNVVLKVSEGLAEQLLRMFSGAFSGGRDAGAAAGAGSPLGDALRQTLGHSMGALRQKLDYSEYGGAPLLGIDGLVMISHGRSDAKAIFNAVRATRRMAEVGLNQRIAERLKH